MNVFLLAAGEGTRLRPHTFILPKPAIPFLNAPLVSFSLGFLQDLPISNLVANTYHLPEKMQATLQRLPHRAQKLSFSHEVEKILGSGGGLVHAYSHFDPAEPIVMMNADEVILPDQQDVMAKALFQHQRNGNIATLITMKHHEAGTKFGAVWCDKDNRVLGFGKDEVALQAMTAAGAKHKLHYIGILILSPEVLKYLPASGESNILYDGLVSAIAKGHKVEAIEIKCRWYETGNMQDYLHATADCAQILRDKVDPYRSYLKQVMSRFAPNTQVTKHEKYTLINDLSAKIDSTKFSGFVVLNERVHVQKGSVLENVVLGSGFQTSPNAQISNQIILRGT